MQEEFKEHWQTPERTRNPAGLARKMNVPESYIYIYYIIYMYHNIYYHICIYRYTPISKDASSCKGCWFATAIPFLFRCTRFPRLGNYMDAVVTDSIQHARQCVQHLKVALITFDHLKVIGFCGEYCREWVESCVWH